MHAAATVVPAIARGDTAREADTAAVPMSTLSVGANAVVIEVGIDGSLGERLLEMGLTAGTPVRLLGWGPGGHTLRLALRGYVLSLARDQAQRIWVQHRGPRPAT